VTERGESRDTFRGLLDAAPDAMIISDRRGRIILANRQAQAMFGYDEADLIGQSVEVLIPQYRADAASLDLRARRRDGTEFPVEISLSPLQTDDGVLVSAAVRDATERRRIERELRASEVRFRGLLDAAPDAMIIVDRAGQILIVNHEAQLLFGYAPEELIGQNVDALVPDTYRAGHVAHRERYVANPRTRPMGAGVDLFARRKDGTSLPVEISLSPLETPDGLLVIAAVRDISERKRIEANVAALREETQQRRIEAERAALAQAARRAEKLAALGTLSAGLAHELNNPIGIMSSRIELLLAEAAALDESVRDDLRVLHRQTQRVARITQGLLSFARQSGHARAPVDLNHIVRETQMLVQSQVAKSGVRFVVDLAPALPAVLGDADTLQQVVLNLVTNARDALQGPGEIRITTRMADAGKIELVVADTGPGIAPEDLARVFDPFFTTKETGTGLGLSITHGIVSEHRGTIDVESAPGQGTRFILTFPAMIPPGEDSPADA
jgi:PAS domain S-box-containing protein